MEKYMYYFFLPPIITFFNDSYSAHSNQSDFGKLEFYLPKVFFLAKEEIQDGEFCGIA